MENCQILSPTANRKKGAFQFKPRLWQEEFLEAWKRRTQDTPFMLIAIPGGGKTMAALEACRQWMAAGADRRVIVVVPTDNLREQWKDEAEKFGISLQSKEFGTDFKHGFQGGVATYNLVASQPLVFRKLCSVAPTMVIFDEIHHCGDDAAFGRGVTTAFELAKERLLMSGTPWKSDGSAIPYVRYDGNGYAVGDFFYDYPRALTEDVVRYLVFDHSKGSITNDFTGETAEVNKEITDEEAQQRLYRILNGNGEYVRETITLAHKRLTECRRTMPDAAALAACIDQNHARIVAGVIKEVTGCEPSVIVSDSEFENDNVRAFRNSKKEWLVAVRKVSEGTDIKRLQVLCYLTNTTTELFFRQLIGRVSRIRGGEDFEAYVFLPADPRLIRCAENIENAQVRALQEEGERESREVERAERQLEIGSYSTTHEGTDVAFIGSERVSLNEYSRIEQIAGAVSLPMQKVLQVLQMTALSPPSGREETPVVQCKEDRMTELRRRCNKLAASLAHRLGVEFREVHMWYKPQSAMSEEELQSKHKDLLGRIRECKS